jgi:hypothetical protein
MKVAENHAVLNSAYIDAPSDPIRRECFHPRRTGKTSMTTTVTRRNVASVAASHSRSNVTAPKKPAHHPSTKPTDSFSSSGSTFNPFDPFGIGKAWATQVAVAAQGGVFGRPMLGYPVGGILGY